MNKRLSLSIIILIISTFLAYGQSITFEKNVNYEAKSLLQSMNKAGDSLLLESKNKQISQIDILNDDFSKSIDVYSNKTKIDLKTLPVGNFVVLVKVDKKWIVMYLTKHKNVKTANSSVTFNTTDIKNLDSYSGSSKNYTMKNPKYYWVVSERNSNFGSSKSMRLEYKEDIDKLISKNKLELKSITGKNNKLLIYEIYDKTEFMTLQFRNPKYYKSADESTSFNTEPIYTSSTEKRNDSNP